ncbi:MAG: hypothetical protein HUU16_00135 [Candidatus Omnitrophica bacterium]|nr:hypothetical protein [Candidatus Omnitrophota bacterium]
MATTFKSVANNAVGTLAADITSGAGAISLSAGQGSAFPSSGSFWVTLFTNSVDDGFEIVLVFTRSGDTFTSLVRGQQGTLASAWTTGTKVQLLWTKGSVDDIHTAINGIENGTTILSGAWLRNTISQYSLIQQSCRNTVSAPQVVQSGDTLFTLIVTGYDGSTYRDAGKLLAKVGTTPGASDMPGAWEFHTTPDGSTTPALAVRIDHTKQLTVEGATLLKGLVSAGTTPVTLTDIGGYVLTAAIKTGTTNNGKFLIAGATEGSASWGLPSTLGIGITTPDSILHVKGDDNDGCVKIDTANGNTPLVSFVGVYSGNLLVTGLGSYAGRMKVLVNGTTFWMPFYN